MSFFHISMPVWNKCNSINFAKLMNSVYRAQLITLPAHTGKFEKPTYKHRSFSNSAWPKLAHGYHMIVVLLLFQLKSSALKGSFISVQMFSTVIFPHLISFTLFKTNETHLIFSWMNGVSFPTNNPQSTRSQKNLKTEVSVWKRIKCFSSRLSRSSRALKKGQHSPVCALGNLGQWNYTVVVQ